MIPLIERTIYVTDRFYDVQALSKDRAIIVGYGGKIAQTTDGGNSWIVADSGTDLALYAIRMADENHGWVVGQEGLVLHTDDGGKTWQKQESNATFKDTDGSTKRGYLFSAYALDANTAWAVGDRSILTSTTDGGKTWTSRKVPGPATTSPAGRASRPPIRSSTTSSSSTSSRAGSWGSSARSSTPTTAARAGASSSAP
jgi:photosystem II stability/assembly factor-like uncharacterized protein